MPYRIPTRENIRDCLSLNAKPETPILPPVSWKDMCSIFRPEPLTDFRWLEAITLIPWTVHTHFAERTWIPNLSTQVCRVYWDTRYELVANFACLFLISVPHEGRRNFVNNGRVSTSLGERDFLFASHEIFSPARLWKVIWTPVYYNTSFCQNAHLCDLLTVSEAPMLD